MKVDPKPIFIVYCPGMALIKSTQEILDRNLRDYHVLVVESNTGGFEFKCFYSKDITEVNFSELKEILKANVTIPEPPPSREFNLSGKKGN